MKKIYYLGTCSTCKRILNELGDLSEFKLQEIKTDPITKDQLEQMKSLAGSYEKLFSRRSMKYRPMGLHLKTLKERDYKNYILKEYTFLKRPVIIVDHQIFVGSGKNEVARAKEAVGSRQ